MSHYEEPSNHPTSLPDTMLALVLSGIGMENLALRTVPTPTAGPGELVARVDAAMACASDNKVVDQGPDHPLMGGWDPEISIILGHEASVTVVSLGEGVDPRFEVGVRCAVQPAIPCGPLHHRERYRNNADGLIKIAVGYSLPGVFAEYILIGQEIIKEDCLIPLRDQSVPHFGVALAEPVSCVLAAQQHAVHILKDSPTSPRRAQIGLKPGGVAVVIGAGPMGKMHVEIALGYHPRVLVVSDPIAERRDGVRQALGKRAEQQGTALVTTTPDELPGEVSRLSSGAGADDVICALGVAAVQEQSLNLLAKGGVTNLFGGTAKGKSIIQVDTRRIHYDSVSVVGSSGGDPSDIAEVVQAIAEGKFDPGNYVAKVGGLDAVIDLIKLVRSQEIEAKGVIYPQVRAPLQDSGYWSKEKEEAFLLSGGKVAN